MQFSVDIYATPEKIWSTLLDDATYRQWTAPFAPGSYAVTDWQVGSKVQFLTPAGNGMYSKIAEHQPQRFLSIEHVGEIKDGVEQPPAAWAGAHENYSLAYANGVSTLTIDMDSSGDMDAYFRETWPRALALVKQLAEA